MSQPLLRRLARVLELHPDIEPVQFINGMTKKLFILNCSVIVINFFC